MRQAKTPTYCRDCKKRKRGNNWKEDYCRWFKKLCSVARNSGKQGGIVKLICDGYKGIN
jgi:hypothetical protein